MTGNGLKIRLAQSDSGSRVHPNSPFVTNRNPASSNASGLLIFLSYLAGWDCRPGSKIVGEAWTTGAAFLCEPNKLATAQMAIAW